MLEPVSAQVDLILRHRVKHERVIRIRGMTQGKDFSLLLLHLRFLRHLSVDFRHRARGIWRAKLCDGLTNVLKRSRSSRGWRSSPLHSKNKTAAAISRDGCLKLLYVCLISSLIGSRPLEASA